MTTHVCRHIKREELPAITVVTQRTSPGAPTRASDLDAETQLCAMCSGEVVALLMALEREQ